MNALKTSFYRNPNIGLYGFATDKYCLLGTGVDKKIVKEIKATLDVPVFEININGSHLVGVYCCGNKDIILVPEVIRESEEKELKKTGMEYRKIKTKLIALGNNIVILDKKCLINPEFEDDVNEQLKDFKVIKMDVAGNSTVGSCIIANKNGCLVSSDVDEKKLKEIGKKFDIKTGVGSVNKGNPFVRSGIICNSKGYIVGGETTGVEIMMLEDVLK